MSELDDHSVHLVITSPPYWQLKDYESPGQIGYHDNYETYINNLNLVWNECYRVLHPGCRLCINIGDQFARSVYYGRYKVIPIREEIIKFCETVGFDYMGAIIWQKVTTSNTTGGGIQMGSYPYPRNGILKIDYEFILIFKKLGEAPKPSKEIKEESKLTPEEWNTFFASHWNFPGVKQDNHIAMFPEELPKRLIKMFSFIGDTEPIKELLQIIERLGPIKIKSVQNYPFSDVDLLSALTERQQEIITLAKQTGYYEIPRKISTEALSEKIGISKSTLIEHLRKAENRIVSSLFRGI